MSDKRTILIFDEDKSVLDQIRSLLPPNEFAVETITDGTQILPMARSQHPSILIANPDGHGFNAYDVCKYVKREMNIPVILLIDKTSTTRAQIDECEPDDVFLKPLDGNGVLNIVRKNISFLGE